MPQVTRQQVSRVVRVLLAEREWTAAELLRWLLETQARNAQAKRAHRKHRQRRVPRTDTF